jgi:hypothetical protein
MIECKQMGCSWHMDDGSHCSVYPVEGAIFRIRQEYCPIPDKYFDKDVQEKYEESKGVKGRRRIGQQKQRR